MIKLHEVREVKENLDFSFLDKLFIAAGSGIVVDQAWLNMLNTCVSIAVGMATFFFVVVKTIIAIKNYIRTNKTGE